MAIDAKDDYTGGHSERVGQYAAILARGMAADYDFSEEDILRILNLVLYNHKQTCYNQGNSGIHREHKPVKRYRINHRFPA